MSVKITEHLNTINCDIANRTKADVKYIVIHYVGATGGALDNCKYFAGADRGASAHLFVGHQGEIYRCIADKNIAWHCGTPGTYYNNCRNSNSIGIELCCYQKSGGTWAFYKDTIESAVELVKEYMAKYGIPAANVVRHYDVTRKLCPGPFCGSAANDKAWTDFKARLTGAANGSGTSGANPANASGYPAGTSGASGGSSVKTVKIAEQTGYIRSDAHTDAKIIKTLSAGTVITWLSDDGWGWSKVKAADGTTGWIQNSRITGIGGLSTWRIATNSGIGVRVREKPNTSGKIIKTICQGAQFNVICILPSNWIMTNIGGADRFIYYDKSYISIGGRRNK